MLALFLCACGDGAISVPAAPLVPVVPVEPSPPLPAAAHSVVVANPADGEILALVGQPRVFAFEFRASQGSASGLTLSLPSMPGWRAARARVSAPRCKRCRMANTRCASIPPLLRVI